MPICLSSTGTVNSILYFQMRTSIKGQVDGLRSDMKVQNAEMKVNIY